MLTEGEHTTGAPRYIVTRDLKALPCSPSCPNACREELSALLPANSRVKVFAPPERKYSVWIGGSVLGSLTTFQKMLISRGRILRCWSGHRSPKVSVKCFLTLSDVTANTSLGVRRAAECGRGLFDWPPSLVFLAIEGGSHKGALRELV